MSKLILDILSDTHGKHAKFKCEGGDILIHAGDCTSGGSLRDSIDFLNWFSSQDYSHLIMIAGNHDWAFQSQPTLLADECRKRKIILLNDSGIILKDMSDPTINIRVWGSPIQLEFNNFAFNCQHGADIKRHWDLIPNNTEILITHCPPYGILDEVVQIGGFPYSPPNLAGCQDLLNKIKETNVKLSVFGHIHEARGIIYKDLVTYVNASSLDRQYAIVEGKPIRTIRETCLNGDPVYIY